MRITYRYIRPCAVLYFRSVGAYAQSVEKAWLGITSWLEATNARHLVRRGFGVFHDDPTTTASDALRFDACIIAAEGAPDADPDAGVGWCTLAGGAYAVHTHIGEYQGTGSLFSKMRHETVAKRGLSLDLGRPFVAIHLNDPIFTRAVHRRTDLCVPVLPIRLPLSDNDDTRAEDHDLAHPTDPWPARRVH